MRLSDLPNVEFFNTDKEHVRSEERRVGKE